MAKPDLITCNWQSGTITRDHRARLPLSNREWFANYQYITYILNKYSLSLYVYARGILGCLLGFWPLGQNPAGAINKLKFSWLKF